jgi:xanthine dehydrogenase YagS FAD-binding subunit
VTARGTRRLPISEFYTSPAHAPERETVLEPGEIVAAIELGQGNAGGWQRYEKLMQRAAWDFALVSLAAVRTEGGDIRLVMGGVAPGPWRVASSVEQDISSGALDPDDVATLADRALYDARPLAGNSYKLALAGTLLRRAIADLSAT